MSPEIIDVHTHIFDEESYQDYQAKAKGRVGKIITIHYSTSKFPPKYSLEEVVGFASGKPDMRVLAAYNIYRSAGHIDAMRRHLKDGVVVGLKMYPGYQPFYPFDMAAVGETIKLCLEFDKPLMFHSGHTSRRGSPSLEHAKSIHIDKLATRFPDLKIVIAHMGFPDFMDTAQVLSNHERVYADLSGTIDKPPSPEAGARLYNRYRDDLRRTLDYFPDIAKKMMFGTDYSGEHSHLTEVESYLSLTSGVFRNTEEYHGVLGGTAKKVFGL